ncbi:MAG: Adaptive-response sensory-kinase SasA [Elusimicrobia bacterium]|nr:Adaptive-response sensory-kinase SasA [Elusimicrobiota bacterium]
MNITGVSVLIFLVTLLNLGFGLFTLKKGPQKKTSTVFFYICLCLSVWTASHAIALTVTSNELALFWTRMIMVGAIFLPWTFSWFANVFEDDSYVLKWPIFILHISVVAFLLVNVFSPDMIREAFITRGGIVWKGGWVFNLYFTYYALFMGYGIFVFVKKRAQAKGLFRAQLSYVLFGAISSISLGLLVSIFLPIIGVTQLNKYGPVGTLLMIGSFSYAIVRYRLMDLRVFIRETARYFLSAGSLAFLMSFVVVVAAGDLRLGFLVFLLSLLLPIGQRRLNNWIVAELSRRGLINSKQAQRVKTISDRIQGVGPNIAHLGATITELMLDLMPTTESSSFFVVNTEKNLFEMVAGAGNIKTRFEAIQTSDPLIEYLDKNQRVLVKSEGARSFPGGNFEEIRKTFEAYKGEVCAPLVVLEKVVGLIFLGEKSDHRAYFLNEVEEIENVAKEASIALKHGLTMANYSSEIKKWAHDLNQTLKPLSQGFEVLVNNDPSIADDPVRSAVYDKMKRPLKKLKEFLHFLAQGARIMGDTLRNQYQLEPINIEEIVRRSIKDFKVNLDNRGINVAIDIKFPSDVTLPGHRGDLGTVFDGLISNSLRYVETGGHISIGGQSLSGMFRIIYENDGPGISPENLERIFLEGVQLDSKESGMMGFGLANSRRIMDLHRGKIWAESVGKDKGVRFVLELPVKATN